MSTRHHLFTWANTHSRVIYHDVSLESCYRSRFSPERRFPMMLKDYLNSIASWFQSNSSVKAYITDEYVKCVWNSPFYLAPPTLGPGSMFLKVLKWFSLDTQHVQRPTPLLHLQCLGEDIRGLFVCRMMHQMAVVFDYFIFYWSQIHFVCARYMAEFWGIPGLGNSYGGKVVLPDV